MASLNKFNFSKLLGNDRQTNLFFVVSKLHPMLLHIKEEKKLFYVGENMSKMCHTYLKLN